MKNSMDKLSKTGLYVISLLVMYFATVLLLLAGAPQSVVKADVATSEVTISMQVEEPQVSIQPETDTKKQIEELPIDTRPEVLTAKVKTAKVVLSRGGSPIKSTTDRETINKYVREITSKYNIDAELIMSVIQTESGYNPKAKNGSCLGLMQVSSRWHAARAKKLGVTNFHDPYSNILLGVDYISELLQKYKDPRLVLMLYNMKHETAISMYKSGKISSYAKTIIARAEVYKKGE